MATLRTLPQLHGVRCFECLDTRVAFTLYGPNLCIRCEPQKLVLRGSAALFAETVWYRAGHKKSLDGQSLNVGRILVHATVEQPISRDTLELLMGLNDRKVKSIVEDLRKEWLLPIGSNRNQPAGYFFIATAADFIEWARVYRSQAITSLATLYRLQRKNFPLLAGQQELDFVRAIEAQLQEELS